MQISTYATLSIFIIGPVISSYMKFYSYSFHSSWVLTELFKFHFNYNSYSLSPLRELIKAKYAKWETLSFSRKLIPL